MKSLISSFNPGSVAICTITYYPKWYRGTLKSIKHTDKVRGDLALNLIQSAKDAGYQIIVCDGKSSKSFIRAAKAIPGTKFIQRRTQKRSPGRRKVIKAASKIPNVEVIVLTEPEKLSFVKDCIFFVVKSIFEGKADIVIPKRDERLFKETYPAYQYESEVEGNSLYNENLLAYNLISPDDLDFDMFFGPRVFRNDPKILSLFMKKYKMKMENLSLPLEYCDLEEISDALFFPVILALQKKFKVKSVEVPFSYPALQKENEEKGIKELFLEKRKNQRLALLIELIHFMVYLNKMPKSRLKLVRK
ncbi:MAG: hypothetical protein Q8P80_00655 [Candidatus Levybacteria bacterium]|nr:hypothetical protein [Candidatus Levybacteria bacterium]